MKVFVAGATGVLGIPAVRELVREGHEVVGTARTKEKADRLRALGAEPVLADLLNRDGLEFALKGCAWVLNLTSVIPQKLRTRPEDWRLNDRVRTEGTRNLTYAARAARVERYVHASVALVHGDHGGAWVEEESALNPGPWLRSALEGETLVQQAQVEGLPAVVVRPGFLYAPDAWHTRWFVENLRSRGFRVPGRGENYVSPIHAEDAARAFIAAARGAEPGQTFLAADDHPLPLREFADAWAGALGVRRPKSAPPFLARLAVGREAVEYATLSQRLSNRKARERLGWAPQYPTVTEGAAAVARLLAGENVHRARGA